MGGLSGRIVSTPVSAGLDPARETTLPWYRQVTGEQWKAFLTTFFAWVLDAFDFTILTFVLINIQQSFTINSALAGLLGDALVLVTGAGQGNGRAIALGVAAAVASARHRSIGSGRNPGKRWKGVRLPA